MKRINFMNENNSQIIKANMSTDKSYCSIIPTSEEEKIKLFNALELCNAKINDEIGQIIKVKDVYVNEYPKVDKNTGETRTAHRTILFDENGKTHVTASNYFYISLMKLLTVWGEPSTWDKPKSIKITQKPVNNGLKALSLQVVSDSEQTVIE